jgi:hypothetical protein
MLVELRTSVRAIVRRSHEVRDLLSWHFGEIDLDDLGPEVSVEDFAHLTSFDPDELVEDIQNALSGAEPDGAWSEEDESEDDEDLEIAWDEEDDLIHFVDDLEEVDEEDVDHEEIEGFEDDL